MTVGRRRATRLITKEVTPDAGKVHPRWSLAWQRAALDPRLIAAAALAAGLRFVGIGRQSFWLDEFVTMDVVRHPLPEMLSAVARSEGTPPLYYVVLWLWDKVFATGDVAIRSLSAVAGILTVLVAYAIVGELGLSRRIARVAALLVAVNPMLIWYSQEARAYSLLALLGALSFLFFIRALRKGGGADYALWAVSSAAAVSTHYFAVFLVAPEAVWLLISRRQQRRRALIASAGVGLVASALLPLVIRQHSSNQQAWIADFSLPHRLAESGRTALLGPSVRDTWLFVILVASVAAAVLLIVLTTSQHEQKVSLTVGCFCVVVVAGSMSLTFDYFLGRNVIAVITLLLVVVAIGLGGSRARLPAMGFLALLCAASLVAVIFVQSDVDQEKPPWRQIAAAIDGNDRVLVVDGAGSGGQLALPLLRYLRQSSLLRGSRERAIREVDFLLHLPNGACGRWSGLACELVLLPVPAATLTATFKFFGRKKVAGFAIDRYRSDRPISVSEADLVPRRDLPSTLVLQTPGTR